MAKGDGCQGEASKLQLAFILKDCGPGNGVGEFFFTVEGLVRIDGFVFCG